MMALNESIEDGGKLGETQQGNSGPMKGHFSRAKQMG
jgi:hypothetical protein